MKKHAKLYRAISDLLIVVKEIRNVRIARIEVRNARKRISMFLVQLSFLIKLHCYICSVTYKKGQISIKSSLVSY